MQSEAKATHSGMLNQSRTLWTKGMTGEVVQALILSLNDLCTPGEITVTVHREGLHP